jgi:hypothetical protein
MSDTETAHDWRTRDRWVITVACIYGDEPHGTARSVHFTAEQFTRLESSGATFRDVMGWLWDAEERPVWLDEIMRGVST